MKKKSLLLVLSVFASTAAIAAAGCGHEHDWVRKSDADYHWYECSEDGEQKEYGAHADADKDGKCDVCNADVHIHEYEFNSDADMHWQECAYGEKTNYGAHVDANDDGVCDTCGNVKQVEVTFDFSGAGESVTESVDYKTKAKKPADPKMEGYEFGGWYSDEDFETEFDFNNAITVPTTLYAKWTEVDEAGANPAHAHALELESEGGLQAFGSLNNMYFKYTAAKAGRYKLGLQLGASSQACKFAISIDNYGTVYDKDGDPIFDLGANETVYVKLIKGTGVTDESNVGVYLSSVVNEPLPESWLDGDYVCVANTFTIDKENNQVIFSYLGNTPFSYNYLGGKINTLTFVQEFYGSNLTYTVTPESDGALVISRNGTKLGTYIYCSEANKHDKSEFMGYYEPVGAKANGVIAVGIESSGDGYIKTSSTSTDQKVIGSQGSVWYSGSSTICYGGSGNNYFITLNVDENGKAVSITVRYGETGEACIYNRTGDVIPTKLPIGQGELYVGSIYSLGEFYGSIRWGSNIATVTNLLNYDAETGIYTVSRGNDSYDIKVVTAENGSKTFLMYDEEGTLVDTLSSDVGRVYNKLPSAAETPVTINLSDLKLLSYYYEVEVSGWYAFDFGENTSLSLYYVVSSSVSRTIPQATYTSGFKLNEGDKLYIKFSEAQPTYTVTVKNIGEANAPAGAVSSNPNAISDVGTVSQSYIEGVKTYYFSFTAPKATKYILTATSLTSNITYTLNFGGEDIALKSGSTSTSITVSDASTPVAFTVTTSATSAMTFRLEEDCTEGTALTFDDDGKGTLTAGGAYYLEDLSAIPYATNLVIGKEDGDEFELIINGAKQTVKTYTFTKDTLARGFVINLANEQSVAYAITFQEGAKQNPHKLTELGVFEADIDWEEQVQYFTVTAPEDIDCAISIKNYQGKLMQFTIDGVNYGYNYIDGEYIAYASNIYKLAKGQTVTVAVTCKDNEVDSAYYDLNVFHDYTSAATVDLSTFNSGDKTEDNAFAAYKDFTVDEGDTLYYFKSTSGSSVTLTSYSDFSVVNSDATEYETVSVGGLFTVTIPAGEDIYIKITTKKSQTISFVLSYALGSEANPYELEFTDGTSQALALKAKATWSILFENYGSYVASGTGSGYFMVDGKVVAKGKLFTVNAGDVVKYVASSASNIRFTYTVPETYEYGKYTDGENTLKLAATGVVIDNKTYTLTAMTASAWTFTNGEDSVALGVDGTTLSYNSKELTFVPMFPKEAVQSYSGAASILGGWDHAQLTITITANGKATVKTSGEFTITATDEVITDNEDGSYTFAAKRGTNSGTITFKFGENGIMNITSTGLSLDAGCVLSPETPWTPSAGETFEVKPGTYSGRAFATNLKLTINADFTAVHDDNGTEYNVTLTPNSDGTYSYEIAFSMYFKGEYTLKANKDGSLTISDQNGQSGVLTPQKDPELSAGTYTAEADGWTYKLVVNSDGTVDYTYGPGSDTTSSKGVKVSYANGKWTFQYKGYGSGTTRTAEITLNADGSLKLDNDVTLTLQIPDLVAGIYKGNNAADNDIEVVLTINVDKKTATLNDGYASFPYDIIYKSGSDFTLSDGTFTYDFTLNDNGTITIVINGDSVVLTRS